MITVLGDYNLKDFLKYNRENGNHLKNYKVLSDILDGLKLTIKLLCDDEIACKLCAEFNNLVEYHALNFHKPQYFYKIKRNFKFANEAIKSSIQFLELIKEQDARKDCPFYPECTCR